MNTVEVSCINTAFAQLVVSFYRITLRWSINIFSTSEERLSGKPDVTVTGLGCCIALAT